MNIVIRCVNCDRPLKREPYFSKGKVILGPDCAKKLGIKRDPRPKAEPKLKKLKAVKAIKDDAWPQLDLFVLGAIQSGVHTDKPGAASAV